MKYARVLACVMVLPCCMVATMAAQPKRVSMPAPHRFISPDHSLTFQYAYPLQVCERDTPSCRGYVPPCDLREETAVVIVCLKYDGTDYHGYNFRGATLSVGILPNAKDKADCLSLPGEKTGAEKINGLLFVSSEDTDHAAGTYVDHYIYRTFSRHCYAADLDIAIVDYGNLDPGTVRKFTSSDETKVLGKLKQVLKTLHISGVHNSDK